MLKKCTSARQKHQINSVKIQIGKHTRSIDKTFANVNKNMASHRNV